jgi:hypothetical protein
MHHEIFSVSRHAQMLEVSCKDKLNCWGKKRFEIPVNAG